MNGMDEKYHSKGPYSRTGKSGPFFFALFLSPIPG